MPSCMSLEFYFFPKIREDVRNMHASCSLMHLHLCIIPPLIITCPNYKIFYHVRYLLTPSCTILLQMPAPVAPARSNTFLDLFGTPTLLRVLNSVGMLIHPATSRGRWQLRSSHGMMCG
jgi:hypothetical protein